MQKSPFSPDLAQMEIISAACQKQSVGQKQSIL